MILRTLNELWGGPLTQNWLDKQLMLQKKIVFRMLELGMTPDMIQLHTHILLPSFSGNVPAALKAIFPSANISRFEDWKIGMEYVHMYLVHWPVKLKPWACSALPNEQDFDKLYIIGTWARMKKCLQMGFCMAIGVTESYSILMVLLICVTKVAKSSFDKALAEHEDIDDVVGSEEPTGRDHGVDLQ
ncbi:hypothetical protein OROMI_005054 [Orobanche minor]